MKKLLLALLLLWQFNCLKAQTSVYHSFPSDSAVWFQSGIFVNNNTPENYNTFYKLKGDTTINTIAYKKIYKGYKQWPASSFPPLNYTVSYIGAIRQDVANKKVYYKPAANSEVTFFDFNLMVGDTIKQIFDENATNIIGSLVGETVKKIDSLLVGSTYRKVFVFDTINPITVGSLIEGVGFTTGLFTHLSLALSGTNVLECYSVKNTTLYSAGSVSQCDLSLSVLSQMTNDELISVYPNPSNGVFNISFINQSKYYEITNALGELISSSNINSNKIEIDLREYDNGIYFLKVITEKGDYGIKKIIKQ